MKTQDIRKNELTNHRFRIGKTGLAMLLAIGTLSACAQAQPTTPDQPPVDPATHARHVKAGAVPPDAANDNPALRQQLSQLQTKVAQLEAALAKNAPHSSATSAPAMSGMAAPAAPMTSMTSGAPGAMKPAAGTMTKMAMMEKMMGMMDKMMSMDDGAMPAGAPMAGGGMGMMDMDDKMKMGGMGGMSGMGGMGGAAMPAGAPTAGMKGGMGMGMDKMEMAGMMGMGAMSSGAAGTMPQSILPGFPGASHIYHIGATDFFLDHPQHIVLTTEQQAALNQAKQAALLAKSTADRAVAQAEQDLWTLTASDQPDAAKIDAKVREVEKLRGDQRLDFIRAVGEAAKLLTDEQRQSLLGLKTPHPQGMPGMPAAPAGSTGGAMKDM